MSGTGNVYLYVGDDEFARGEAARELVHTLVPESERAFGLEVIEGRADNAEAAVTTLKRCLEAFLTRGFLLSNGKVVWWRDVAFMADARISQAEDVKAGLKNFSQVLKDAPSGGNVLLITAPKMDKRSALYKVCAERHQIREFFIPEKSNEAEKYGRAAVRQAFLDCKLRASPAVMDLFYAKVGADTRQIRNEADKLSLFTHGRHDVTEDDIDVIVSASGESAMWDIQDAVGRRQLARSLQVLRRLLAQRESSIGIITVITNRLKELLVYREALDKGWLRLKPGYGDSWLGEWCELTPDVEDVLTVVFKKSPRALNSYRMGILGAQAKASPAGVLRRNQRLAMAAHEALVSSSVPEGMVLELMLAKMMA